MPTAILDDININGLPDEASVTLPVGWIRESRRQLKVVAAEESSTSSQMDLTVDQVAALFGRRPSTVRQWCAAGDLDAYKLNGREWRISRDAIAQYQKQQRDGNRRHLESRTKSAVPITLGSWRSA